MEVVPQELCRLADECLGVIAPPLKPALALESMNGAETIVHGQVPFESQHLFCSDPVPFS